MFDRYTKTVLTIIAVALTVLAIHHVIPTATAVGAAQCGTYQENPCWVRLYSPLEVDHH